MDKASNIKVDINRCKKIIEHQLGWSNDFVLTKREYDILIEKIFEKTGVLLSLSTIRRIWSDDFKNIPHKITLDALAAFTGYIDWQHFVETQSKNKETKTSKNRNIWLVIGSIIAIVIIISAVMNYILRDNEPIEIVGEIVFNYTQQNDSTIPNIIVFDYDVSNIVADSFFIVESTNDYQKRRLKIKSGQMTSSYYRPGNFEAFLMADDSIVRKLDIEIISNSWIGMMNYSTKPGNLPYYFYENEIIDDGIMVVSRDKIISNNIEITNDMYLTLAKTFISTPYVQSAFTFESRIKLDSIEVNLSCPKIYLGLLFENEFCYFPIIQNGGQDKIQLKFGNTYQTSEDSDLSGFGCNIHEWQILRVVSKDSGLEVMLNDKVVTTFTDSSYLGPFKGFSFTFDGIGSVDYVSLLNHKGDTVYFDSFVSK